MPLHVLRHVIAQQLDAHNIRQLLADLSLAHTGWAGKQKRTNRSLDILQASSRQFDRRAQGINSLVLAKHNHLELGIEVTQCLFV